MSAHSLETIDTTVQKTYRWLHELRDDLHTDDSQQAYQALRAVLHAVRDRLSVDDAAAFAAEFPLLIRGMYFEGWRPAGKPEKLSREEFLRRVESGITASGVVDPVRFASAVLRVISSHIAPGQTEKIRRTFPQELQQLWPKEAAAN